MKIIKDIKNLKSEIKKAKKSGKIIGLVPTMGAIHLGHLSLVKEIKKKADLIIATIFVNQKQFNNSEDFKKYPSTLEADIAAFKKAGVDILFTPDAKEIYPQNFVTTIHLEKITQNLCGKTRPGHFDGVALIITKLFNITEADIAIFGQKDFQQLQIIRKLVEDLNINIQIIAAKTMRQNNGLALSSRNLRLNEKELKIAPLIQKNLLKMKQEILAKKEKSDLKKIIIEAAENLTRNSFGKIDYLEICDEENLNSLKKFDSKKKSRIFIAVYLGKVRLIDNLELYQTNSK